MKIFGVFFAVIFVVCVSFTHQFSDFLHFNSFNNIQFILNFQIFRTHATEIQTPTICTSNETSTKIIDLPVEILLNIFENLDLKDLYSVSRTHSKSRNVVSTIFQKFHKYRFSNWFFDISDDNFKFGADYKLSLNSEFSLILNFIRNFGHLMTKLKVTYYPRMNQKQCHLLNEYINEYVTEFMEEIDLGLGIDFIYCSVNFLKGPFPKVEAVTFSRANMLIFNDQKINISIYNRIPSMFPAMRSLEFKIIEFEGSLNHFPLLERFAIDTYPYNWATKDIKPAMEALEKTIKVNPQLRHLKLNKFCQWYTLEMLAKYLPNLESLEIIDVELYSHYYSLNVLNLDHGYQGKTIQFKNMTYFRFIRERAIPFEIRRELLQQIPLEFGNLEHIEFEGVENINEWSRIILKNQNLKRIVAKSKFTDRQLEQIADELPNLEQFSMTFQYGDQFSIDGVVQFLRKTKQMKDATFHHVNERDCKAAAEQLPEEWVNSSNDGTFCTFLKLKLDAEIRKKLMKMLEFN